MQEHMSSDQLLSTTTATKGDDISCSGDSLRLPPTGRQCYSYKPYKTYTLPDRLELLRQNGCFGSTTASRRHMNVISSSFGCYNNTSTVCDDLGTKIYHHPYSSHRVLTREALASSIAWNPTRIRNMMLAVGPGTPAAILWKTLSGECGDDDHHIGHDSSDDEYFFDDGDNDDDDNLENSNGEDDEDDEDNDGPSTFNNDEVKDDDNDDDEDMDEVDDDDDEDSVGDDFDLNDIALAQRVRMQRLSSREEHEEHRNRHEKAPVPNWRDQWLPGIKHDGCINTACWLNVPWRIVNNEEGATATKIVHDAAMNGSSYSQHYEIPTQLITSGDDRTIKFWDVKYAMGAASPLYDGWDTLTPLSSLKQNKDIGTNDLYKSWIQYYNDRNSNWDQCCSRIAGSVLLLTTMRSHHRGNVFDVVPLGSESGTVLSCGADGFLRKSVIGQETSSIVIDPTRSDGESSESFLDEFNRMAFSIQLLTKSTGLLCSERGLHRFDMRLSANEQSRYSLLPSNSKVSKRSRSCKVCAVWSPNHYQQHGSYPSYLTTETEANYIFAGGNSGFVELLDLRMTSSSCSLPSSSNNTRVLQRFRPNPIERKKPSVSVSGIDVSRDGRELLVSYENDQIYTFNVFPTKFPDNGSGSNCPTLKDIDKMAKECASNKSNYVNYKATYGGHMNRVTFLKNARYAGPNDEYILTGSDSGKAWIYERSTGAVAALLGADSTVCNGIIPHPTLPYFATYGIDSTAKIWRASSSNQDSPLNRLKASLQREEYVQSPLCTAWDRVQDSMRSFLYQDHPIFADLIVPSEDSGDIRGQDVKHTHFGMSLSGTIGNALRCLPIELSQIKYRYFRSTIGNKTPLIAQSVFLHSYGMSWRRLHWQATSLGMRINRNAPWIFEDAFEIASSKRHGQVFGFHVADLVPNYPSDWIPYHAFMSSFPFLATFYAESIFHPYQEGTEKLLTQEMSKAAFCLPWLSKEKQEEKQVLCDEESLYEDFSIDFERCFNNDYNCWISSEEEQLIQTRSQAILDDTVEVIKNGGNDAMKLGLLYTAIRRYDKAINYCAVALIPCDLKGYQVQMITTQYSRKYCWPYADPSDSIKNSKSYSTVIKNKVIAPKTSCTMVWSPILRHLIACRLNLSLLMVKPELGKFTDACIQAVYVLRLLRPFVTTEKKVILILMDKSEAANNGKDDSPNSYSIENGSGIEVVVNDNEPMETYREGKVLQSKAYYRLGCGQYGEQNYGAAVKSFQSSLDCFYALQALDNSNNGTTTDTTNTPNISKPDSALLRKLHDAKVQWKKSKERTKKLFKNAMSSL